MIFWVWFALSVVGALVHLAIQTKTPRTKARVVEVLLLYFLAVYYGFAAFVSGLGHLVLGDQQAEYIGWPAGNPFQDEFAFASLGLTTLEILAIWLRGTFWIAPALGYSILLLGAAYVHIREIMVAGNLAPGNAGPVLFFDVLVPVIVLGLLGAHLRLGPAEGLREDATRQASE